MDKLLKKIRESILEEFSPGDKVKISKETLAQGDPGKIQRGGAQAIWKAKGLKGEILKMAPIEKYPRSAWYKVKWENGAISEIPLSALEKI